MNLALIIAALLASAYFYFQSGSIWFDFLFNGVGDPQLVREVRSIFILAILFSFTVRNEIDQRWHK